MKKILFSLVALVCCMSMNAQVMKVMKGNVVVATYTAEQADNVVFEEAQGSTTTGTAKRTGNIDVNWVQLWADGPKFAEYNVGASSVTDIGTTMTFTEAINEGADYVWGANWCTPSKADMDELLKAASPGSTSAKVKCECVVVSGIYGFKFTGKEEGYTDNSVFFPAQDGDSDYSDADYWSGTVNGSEAWRMYLLYIEDDWYSEWYSVNRDDDYHVRPVLKN